MDGAINQGEAGFGRDREVVMWRVARGSQRRVPRWRWALGAVMVLALTVGIVACGDGGTGADTTPRWDTAVWGSARWAQ